MTFAVTASELRNGRHIIHIIEDKGPFVFQAITVMGIPYDYGMHIFSQIIDMPVISFVFLIVMQYTRSYTSFAKCTSYVNVVSGFDFYLKPMTDLNMLFTVIFKKYCICSGF